MDQPRTSPFHYDRQVLDCVIGGVSTIDIRMLHIQSEEEAVLFVQAYGYDLSNPDHLEQLWATHRRAVSLIEEQLLEPGEQIPNELRDPEGLGKLTNLLLAASSRAGKDREMQRWACAILRVMHVFVHSRHDLFGAFRDEIQAQILKPLQDAIVADDIAGSMMLAPNAVGGAIHLHKFEIKPFKTTASSVIKLLARPERVALTILDKLGVRLVTRSLYDSFRVVRYLVESNLVSFPHIMPDQSANTLFPLNLFMETMGNLEGERLKGREITQDEIQEALARRLSEAESAQAAQYLEKPNQFSGSEYRFLKFINRKLISVPIGDGEQRRAFRFFYPYEIQVMDQETYARNLMGPMAHDEYKARQRKRARDRVMGESSS
ncbi:MAG: TIGR04552 family protein [Bdellovibrionota bacterium]